MYIIYNSDGSIRKVNLTDYIQKGNNNVNTIFLAINGLTNSSWTCTALFTLPNDSVTSVSPVAEEKNIEGVTYSGWTLSIPASATVYEGKVGLSISVTNLQQQTLFTYEYMLVINPSSVVPNETTITYAQYQSLLQLVLQKPSLVQTIAVVPDITDDLFNVEALDEGQIIYSKEQENFYIYTGGELSVYAPLDFVKKTTDAYKLYGTGTTGGQVTITWSQTNDGYSIARRKPDGNLSVNQTPNANDDATSKKYVDDKVADMLQKSFQSVNTTIYPTLASFLLSTGQEGYVYLYPINTADLSQGQYQYIWEGNAWVLIGTTNIDMSDYVKKTSSAKQLYGTDITGAQTTYTLTAMIMADSPAQRDSNGNIATPNSPTSDTSAINVNYANAHYVQYTSGGYVPLNGLALEFDVSEIYEDSDTAHLKILSIDAIDIAADEVNLDGRVVTINDRDVLKELDQLKAEFYEGFVDIQDYSFAEQYLYALPTTISSQPLLYSAGMDVVAIKGRTLAVNQAIRELTSTYWDSYSSTYTSCSFNNGKITVEVIDNTNANDWMYGVTSPTQKSVVGHKYLLYIVARSTKFNSFYLDNYGGNINFAKDGAFSIWTCSNEYNSIIVEPKIGDVTLEVGDTFDVEVVKSIDLTQMFNGNSNIPADLLSHPENFFQYFNGDLSYNEGKLVHSVPTKFIARGFNQWDEEWEVGAYDSSGDKTENNSAIRSKNYIRVNPNTSYFYGVGTGGYLVISYYDKNNNFVSQLFGYGRNDSYTTPPNAFYMTFAVISGYGSSYRNDICINVSNASFNGTYKPFTKDERAFQYPPTLKGIDSTCYDDTALKKTKVYEFTGEEVWQYFSQENAFACRSASADISDVKTSGAKTMTSNGIVCEVAKVGVLYTIVVKLTDNPQLTSSSDLNEIFVEGSELLYELATPTAQAGHTSLPEDIKIEEGGTLECVYQADGETPLLSIDTQVATIK